MGATCSILGPGQEVHQRPEHHSPWSFRCGPPRRHFCRHIDAEEDKAHHSNCHAQEPHHLSVAFKIGRDHQAESAEAGVESRDRAVFPIPSQQCVVTIHDTGIKTANRANKALTPRRRSRITSTLSEFIMTCYP
jgi:hypothetical protein